MNRPKKGEYTPFYQGYVDAVPKVELISFLKNQQDMYIEMLYSHKNEDLSFTYAEEKWTIAQVLGHINDVERLMSYRALCIARGDKQRFPGFDQNDYAKKEHFESRDVHSFSTEFQGQRMSNIALYKSFGESEIGEIGMASGVKFSVRALMFITAGHLAHHINVLSNKYNFK